MAITELFSRTRNRVAYFGGSPSGDDERSFTERGFLFKNCAETDLQDSTYLSGLAAVVFTQSAEKPLHVTLRLEKYAHYLLNHDCRIFVRLAQEGEKDLREKAREIVINCISRFELPAAGLSPAEQAMMGDWMIKLEGNPLNPSVHLCDIAVDWPNIANLVAENPPGKAPNFDLIIKDNDGKEVIFCPSSDLLIRRAFWDCSEVHLIPMLAGLSDASVYRAYAELAQGHYGRWPRPYFVKIGKRSEIFAEYKNYESGVRPYIPFHLGPHLVHDRCCLGAEKAIIVGDLVEESENLRDCASDGRAAAAIACLFNSTLRSWYLHAHEDSRSVAAYLLPLFPDEIPTHRQIRVTELGATKSLTDLRALFEKCIWTPVLVGPIHGDLHATNVLVRSTDAIIIDFQKHCENPLVYDAACLEAGLLVDGFGSDKREGSEWINSIKPLYEKVPLQNVQARCHPTDPSSWFYECAQQIRLYARKMERCENQYAAALAIALLKKASNKHQFAKPKECHRAGAYVIAELILTTMFPT